MEKLKESLLSNQFYPQEDEKTWWYNTIRNDVNRYINGSLDDLTRKYILRNIQYDKHEITTNIIGNFDFIKHHELMEHIAKKFNDTIQKEDHKIIKIKIIKYVAVCELSIVITKKEYIETYSDILYYWYSGYSNF